MKENKEMEELFNKLSDEEKDLLIMIVKTLKETIINSTEEIRKIV